MCGFEKSGCTARRGEASFDIVVEKANSNVSADSIAIARARAYAKINLTLEIGEKQACTYHRVDTVMQKVELYDDVCVTLRDDSEINLFCDPKVCATEDNLAYKAAVLFSAEVGKAYGCDIRISKRIPDRAGLAGGSADAAAVLDCLEALTGEKPHLEEIAAKLGADVPFCLGKYICARGSGTGTRLDVLPPLPTLFAVIAVPKEGLSTKAVYDGFDEFVLFGKDNYADGSKTSEIAKRLLPSFGEGEESCFNVSELCSLTVNSFEKLCTSLCPEIADTISAFTHTDALCVRMSGSGSAVFGLYENEASAKKACTLISECLPFLRFTWCGKTLSAR